MERRVAGFRKDEVGDWVAILECGHERHVRHDPPWMMREWVLTEAGRTGWIGRMMVCRACGAG